MAEPAEDPTDPAARAGAAPDAERHGTPVLDSVEVEPTDLRLSLGIFRAGGHDPSMRIDRSGVWRATRTPEGPATIHLEPLQPIDSPATIVRVRAWGRGAGWACAQAPELLGRDDRPDGFVAHHRAVRDLARRRPHLRIGRTRAVVEALLPTILEQKVATADAHRSWHGIVRAFGEAAPGPADLRLGPDPDRFAELGYAALHPFGVERRRAETMLRVCRSAAALERLADRDPVDARVALESVEGIGPWTAGVVALRAFGDADAVPVGDYHLPHIVSWMLAGEPRGDDARMLELLAPYAGHRARVLRWLEVGGSHPPRRGPRMPLRSIARM